MSKIDHKKAALTVLTLVDKWQLNEKEKMALLGFDANSIPLKATSELEEQLTLLLNIHSELRQLFSNPTNVYGYMTMTNHNAPFNGSRPVELACKGSNGLYAVYCAIRDINS